MSDKIRIGVIGGGAVGAAALAYVRGLEGVEIAAVVEPNAAVRKRLEEEYGVRGFGGIEEMLGKAELDAVKICTPNFLHAGQAISCLEAGLHVHCEKPMATTLDDCRRVIAAAQQSGKVFVVNFEYRHSLIFRRVKEIIDAGEIGRPVNLYCYERRGMFGRGGGGWRFDSKSSGGLFPEKLCHYIDLALWYCGAAATRVQAFSGANTVPDYTFPDNATAFFEIAGGRSFTLATHHGMAGDPAPLMTGAKFGIDAIPPLQWLALGHSCGFGIAGEGGAIMTNDWMRTLCVNRFAPGPHGLRMSHERVEDFSLKDWASCVHNQNGMIAHFLDLCREDRPVVYPEAGELLATMSATFAAECSLVERRAIEISPA